MLRRRTTRLGLTPGWVFGALTLGLHLYVNAGYGWFRDEMYFIVCGWSPDWGYVDQPPLVPLIAAALHGIWPANPIPVRFVPALAHAGTVLLTAEMARVLGGGRFAQSLAALAVLTAPVFLATGTILTTDVFQPPSWLLCAYAIARVQRDGDGRWWWVLAAAAAIGLLSKYTIAFWLVALLLGLVATPARRVLMDRRPWLVASVVAAVVAPNVLWQASHGFPFLELGRYAVEHKNVVLTPWAFMLGEAKDLNLGAAPVWLAGLFGFLFVPRLSDLRWIAIAYSVVIVLMIVLHGKTYYPVAAYPVLLAGGAAVVERWRWRSAVAASTAVLGAIGLPFGLPVLPIQTFIAYQDALGLRPTALQNGPVAQIPQLYADMFGWDEMIALVARAYASLSPEEKARVVFLGDNYGDTAAIDVLGGRIGLPPSISGHNNYYLWGPRGHDGSIVIRVGRTREALLRAYASVEEVGIIDQPLAMPWVNRQTFWICRGRNVPLDQDWASFRHYD